ncbi:putative uncharacterized protein FLJ46214 [Zalophus californianus]|uniref:Uncharacterized protein n=1 Tax=Zalophus californianus TaxID=9704 RepID=A0A6J2D208_ZALCA|nr:putative uncharacterized protein FLJ46214 [Zalophus californianus]
MTQGPGHRAPGSGSGPTQDRLQGRTPHRPGPAPALLSVEATPPEWGPGSRGSAQAFLRPSATPWSLLTDFCGPVRAQGVSQPHTSRLLPLARSAPTVRCRSGSRPRGGDGEAGARGLRAGGRARSPAGPSRRRPPRARDPAVCAQPRPSAAGAAGSGARRARSGAAHRKSLNVK